MFQGLSYHNRTEEEIGNGSCYLWLTFMLLTVSGICFAVCKMQPVLFIVAIVLVICAFLTAILYLIRLNKVRKLKSGCDTTTANEQKGFCVSCWTCILCLTNEDYSSRTAGNANTPGTDSTHVVSVDDATEDPLTQITRAIRRLRQQYAFLKRQECVDSIIEQDFVSLDLEERKVRSWNEDGIPSGSDIESMNERLKRIARNFRLARLRIHSKQYSGTSRDLEVNVNMDAPEQVQIFNTDVPMPPSYSQLDLVNLYTHHNVGTSSTTQDPHLYTHHNVCTNSTTQATLVSATALRTDRHSPHDPIATVSDGSMASDNIVQPCSFVFQVYHNAASFRANGRQDSLEPPLDDSEAPPCYDEVTASPV